MDSEEKKYRVAFNVFRGIGPARFKLLLDFFGSAKSIYEASEKSLKEVGLPQKLVGDFLHFRKRFNFSSYLLRLEKLGIAILYYEEKNYPKLLKEVNDAPLLIYYKKKKSMPESELASIIRKKMIAVVGTRKMTDYGQQITKIIVGGMVDRDWVIVSGLARGVDGLAHEHTIHKEGITIAVMGTGLDCVYPPEHTDLANKIVESGGLLVSEFPLDAPISRGNFPSRNRIISGLSQGVVVIEAAEKSGSLITASAAAEQGREVFAVPGPVTSILSGGTLELIKKGARPVAKAEDILEEFERS